MMHDIKSNLFLDGILPSIWRFSFAYMCLDLGFFLANQTGMNGIIQLLASDKTNMILSNVTSFAGISAVIAVVSMPIFITFPLFSIVFLNVNSNRF